MPRNATPTTSDAHGLTPAQLKALAALLMGASVTEAASSASVARETVHRWQRDDLDFRAAYNQGRIELREAAQGELLRAAREAARVVAGAIHNGDVRTSLVVLKALGLLEPYAIGSSEPAFLKEEEELNQKERAHSLEIRSMMAEPYYGGKRQIDEFRGNTLLSTLL